METEILPLEITVIPAGEFRPNDVQEMNLKLRAELYETAVQSAEFSASQILFEGVKGLESIDWSSILITLAGSGSALLGLFGVLQSWINRNQTELFLTAPNGTSLHVKGDLDDIDLTELVSQFQAGVQRESGVEITVEEGGKLIVDGSIVGGDQKLG